MASSSSSLGGVDSLDISGTAEIWDATPEIRERLRAGHQLFGDVSDRSVDIKTPAKLDFVIRPLLVKMREGGKKVPSIDALRHEIKALYKISRVEVDETHVEGSAWSLRKHCGFIKMKVRKEKPSMAPSLHSV